MARPSRTPPVTSLAPEPSIQSSTRSVAAGSISGATRVSGERGSPTTTSFMRAASRSRNSSCAASSTSTRCTEMHACPEA